MRRYAVILFALLTGFCLSGQLPVGSWSDHLNYSTAKSVAAGTDMIFASTGSSVIVFDKEYNETRKLSKVNGLTATGISSIAWSGENELLIVAYNSTNIDLVRNNIIYNIPDITLKYIAGEKDINRIRTSGKYGYLATSFGIVVVDLIKREIYDTWKPGPLSQENEIYDIAFSSETVYAATELGIWYGNLQGEGLSFPGNWTRMDLLPDPEGKYTHAVFSGNTLFVNKQGASSANDQVFAIENENTLHLFSDSQSNTSFDPAPEGFLITSPGSVRYYRSDGTLIKNISSYGWGIPNISQAAVSDGDLWIADLNYGLIRGEDMTGFEALIIPGPAYNGSSQIISFDGKTIICGGGTDDLWNGLGRPFMVSVHQNNNFRNILLGTASDALRVTHPPGSDDHLFVSTWEDGLFEYKNNTLVKHYNGDNSPLVPASQGLNEVRICGIAADKVGNLWVAQPGVTASIKTLRTDGSWIVNPVPIDAPLTGDMIITSGNLKWMVLPGGYGLFILDDNNTPDLFTDDRYKKLTIRDTEGNIIPSAMSLAEDLDGSIWVGTTQGPVIYSNPGNIFSDDPRAVRIKIPRNDGTGLADYMLGTETITSIAVDGGNRKWLGTESSGAYLLSDSGNDVLQNYNEKNSPLFSDTITGIAVDNVSGEVWFGTTLGLISLRGEATGGTGSFTNVYPFPNPVREDFQGNVTITGLIRDSQIRITDVSGNLVYETVSEGGQATWDLTTYRGKRVATGVYLIFCSSSDGSESVVTKILVIR